MSKSIAEIKAEFENAQEAECESMRINNPVG